MNRSYPTEINTLSLFVDTIANKKKSQNITRVSTDCNFNMFSYFDIWILLEVPKKEPTFSFSQRKFQRHITKIHFVLELKSFLNVIDQFTFRFPVYRMIHSSGYS